MNQPGSLLTPSPPPGKTKFMALVRGQIAAGVPAAPTYWPSATAGWSNWATVSPPASAFLPDLMFAGIS